MTLNLPAAEANAREFAALQAAASDGLKLRPDKYDDWGLVRDGDMMPVANFATIGVIACWENAPAWTSPGWNDGPPLAIANANLFIAARNTTIAADLLAAVAEIKRLRDALGTALRQWEGYADEMRSVCDDWIATAKDSEACAFRAARDALQPLTKASE